MDKLEPWIGLCHVIPRVDCELLTDGKAAYVNFVTLACDADEFRTKVTRACGHYKLDVTEIEQCETFTERHMRTGVSELAEIADELTDPKHVRYGTFHTYPRKM